MMLQPPNARLFILSYVPEGAVHSGCFRAILGLYLWLRSQGTASQQTIARPVVLADLMTFNGVMEWKLVLLLH